MLHPVRVLYEINEKGNYYNEMSNRYLHTFYFRFKVIQASLDINKVPTQSSKHFTTSLKILISTSP